MILRYTIVNTVLGWVSMVCSEKGIVLVTLPQTSYDTVIAGIETVIDGAIEDVTYLDDFSRRLKCYFQGDIVDFPYDIDICGATEFQRAVWYVTRTIPFGETRSYGWVAQQIGKPQAYRAVGWALARNRLPIIVPCHRVIASDGNLGGFSGGLVLKKRLLNLELGRDQWSLS